MPADPCLLCDLPHDGPRYTAGIGEHEWMRPRDTRPVNERTSDRVTEERERTPEMGHPLPPIDRHCNDSDPCGYCKPGGAGARLPFGRTTA